jgi:hypothetical protein
MIEFVDQKVILNIDQYQLKMLNEILISMMLKNKFLISLNLFEIKTFEKTLCGFTSCFSLI